jgi:hypothetical protein
MSLSLAPCGCPFGGLFLYVCMYVCICKLQKSYNDGLQVFIAACAALPVGPLYQQHNMPEQHAAWMT